MENLSKLIQDRFQKAPKAASERGELLEFFASNVNASRDGVKYKKLPIGYFARKLQGLEVKDLYFLKSVCESERRRGAPFSKVFFGQLKVKSDV